LKGRSYGVHENRKSREGEWKTLRVLKRRLGRCDALMIELEL